MGLALRAGAAREYLIHVFHPADATMSKVGPPEDDVKGKQDSGRGGRRSNKSCGVNGVSGPRLSAITVIVYPKIATALKAALSVQRRGISWEITFCLAEGGLIPSNLLITFCLAERGLLSNILSLNDRRQSERIQRKAHKPHTPSI